MLIESEQLLTLGTESARIRIWDWDVVTNQLVWDAQMYALYGGICVMTEMDEQPLQSIGGGRMILNNQDSRHAL